MANLTTQIADTVTSVGVKASYGEPVEVDGATIIPVATAWYGFGAGEGDAGGDAGEGQGSGGGGGGVSLPVGAYVTQGGRTTFEPNIIALLAVGVPFVCVAGKALARVLRALRGKR